EFVFACPVGEFSKRFVNLRLKLDSSRGMGNKDKGVCEGHNAVVNWPVFLKYFICDQIP
ncbi:hypothetical protein AVEN_146420-1, partial [Araneus ventricosus]